MVVEKETERFIRELRQIKRLMISSLIISGVEATTIAKILDYKRASSISNEIPVGLLKKTVPTVRVQTTGKPRRSGRQRSR